MIPARHIRDLLCTIDWKPEASTALLDLVTSKRDDLVECLDEESLNTMIGPYIPAD